MNSIIISAIGLDRPGIVSELTGIINNHGGNIEESRMSKLGMDFAVIMLVKVNSEWKDSLTIALQAAKDFSITIKNTQSSKFIKGSNCQILLTGADNEGIINVLSKYFFDKSINILDLNTHISNAPVTGTPLFNLKAIVSITQKLKTSEIQSDLDIIARKLGVEIIVNHANSDILLDTA